MSFIIVDNGGHSSAKDLEHILSGRELPYMVVPAKAPFADIVSSPITGVFLSGGLTGHPIPPPSPA